MQNQNTSADAQETKSFCFCPPKGMLVRHLPKELGAYYSDLQDDFRKWYSHFVEWGGMGYLQWEEGKDDPIVIGPEASEKERILAWPNCHEEVGKVLEVLRKGGTDATNNFGVFYTKYEMNGPKSNNAAYKFIEEVGKKDLDDSKFRQRCVRLAKDGLDGKAIATRLNNGEHPEEIKREVEEKLLEKFRRREKLCGKFNARRSKDRGYCTALLDMVSAQFNSWCELNKDHLLETDAMNAKMQEGQEKLGCNSVYVELCNFANALEDLNSGLTKKVMYGALDDYKKNNPNTRFGVAVQCIKNYPVLLDANKDALGKAYKLLRLHWKLKNRKQYISKCRFSNHYPVPFGLTGKGHKFSLAIVNDELHVSVDGLGSFVCYRSHYFHNLKVVKQKENYYKISFCHKLKDKKKDVCGPNIEAELREIKIQKYKDNYYLSLPFKINHPAMRFSIAKFFMSTDWEGYDLPNVIKAGAADLNISTPLTAVKATLHKGRDGKPIFALGYGSGELDGQPVVVAGDTTFSKRIQGLARDMWELIDAVREYKASKSLSAETESSIGTEKIPGSYRLKIQTVIGRVIVRYRKYRYESRVSGHHVLSENVRLLQLMDAKYSLVQSWKNIHLKKGDKSIYSRKVDSKRQNFRKFVAKQYAHELAVYAAGLDVFFVEDLDSKFDFDNDNNSIARLFAAGLLMKYIENAFNKCGIGLVFVPPHGTSKTDGLTGMPGFRPKPKDKMSKEFLFVKRDNQIQKTNSDLMAPLNVLLLGLNHSIPQRKVWVGKTGKISVNEDSTTNKRLKKFLKLSGLSSAFFYLDESTVKVCTVKPAKPLTDLHLYPYPGGFLTEKQKAEQEEEIKDQVKHRLAFGPEVQACDATPSHAKSYLAFQVNKVLEAT